MEVQAKRYQYFRKLGDQSKAHVASLERLPQARYWIECQTVESEPVPKMCKRSAAIAVWVGVGVGVAALVACWPYPTVREIESSIIPTLTPGPPPPTAVLAWQLAHGEPCPPPCWEGLTPGVSSWDEVYQTMERLLQSEQFTYADCASPTHCWVIDQHGNSIDIYERDDDWKVGLIVGEANTHFYGGELDLDIQQLIDLIGEPQWVYGYTTHLRSFPLCPCDALNPTPYPRFSENAKPVDLIYLERGASFVFEVPPDHIRCICPHMKLERFCYFPPLTSIEEYTDHLERYGVTFPPAYMDEGYRFAPWQGFGRVYSEPNP